jgi:tetratricopeptide (TPR) repeat protein
MPRIHPRPGIIDGLLQLLPEARGRILRHVESCPACRGILKKRPPGPAALPGEKGESGGRLLSWPDGATESGRAVDGVLERFRTRLHAAAREQGEAPALLAELLEQPPERREVMARNSRRFRSLSLCGLLLQRAYQDSFDDPGQGERLAGLALALVESLDLSRYGDRVLADARGRGWMIVGNARRVAGDLSGAEAAFETAEADLRAGTGDWLEKAQLLVYRACLRRTQDRLDEAALLFRRSVSVFLSAHEPGRAAESIVGLALTEHRSGELEAAIHTLEAASILLDSREDPQLALFIYFSRLLCLVDAGRPFEARGLLTRNPGLYSFPGEVILQLRLLWLEAGSLLSPGS